MVFFIFYFFYHTLRATLPISHNVTLKPALSVGKSPAWRAPWREADGKQALKKTP
jgi:hypothetical protein